MSDLPEPLTPPDCDLRGYEWMALLGDRLFKSTFYRKARKDPRAGLAGLKLWWEAMQQTPAGSLPNDEEDLCMLADFGEDMKTWRKHRAVAMHGWQLCSDGRLYHSTVAEQANVAWEQKRRAKDKRDTDAERLRRWRMSKNGHPPQGDETPPETRFTTHCETPDETPTETRVVHRKYLDTVQDSVQEKEKQDNKNNNLLFFPNSARESAPTTAQRLEAQNCLLRVAGSKQLKITGSLDAQKGERLKRELFKDSKLDRWDQAKLYRPRPGAIHLTPQQLAVVRAKLLRRA